MDEYSVTVDVAAPVERIWSVLLEKVENPQKFIADVTGVEIVERYDDGVLRKMRFGDEVVTERIEIHPDRRLIRFTLVDHPRFTGEIVNVISGPDDAPFLTVSGGWTERGGETGLNLEKAFRATALKTKVMAEEG